jgi:endonuclease YncB( thermonuclease family)
VGLVALLLTGSAGAAEPAAVLEGRVTKVNDGDSIEVDLASGHVRVRLSAIDTPEADQPYGDHSTKALRTLLPVGSEVELEVVTQDQFRRLVAVVWRVKDGKRVNLNETMLREGHAWAYRRYAQDTRYCDLEDEARVKKSGLWSQPVSAWVYPPEWRFLKNGEIRALPVAYEESRATCIAVLNKAGKGTYEPPK